MLVVVLQFTPSTVNLFHQMPGETTTPGFTVSPTIAFARNRPRSLNTVTDWPLAMPRTAASDGWISSTSSGCQATFWVLLVCEPTLYWVRIRPVVRIRGKRRVVRSSMDDLSSPTQLSLAAAQFGEKLRGSYWARNLTYKDILGRFDEMSSTLRGRSDVAELQKLVQRAAELDKRGDKFEAEHGPIARMDFDRVPVLR